MKIPSNLAEVAMVPRTVGDAIFPVEEATQSLRIRVAQAVLPLARLCVFRLLASDNHYAFLATPSPFHPGRWRLFLAQLFRNS